MTKGHPRSQDHRLEPARGCAEWDSGLSRLSFSTNCLIQGLQEARGGKKDTGGPLNPAYPTPICSWGCPQAGECTCGGLCLVSGSGGTPGWVKAPKDGSLCPCDLFQSLGVGFHGGSGGHISAGCMIPASAGCRPTWGWWQVGFRFLKRSGK